MSERDSPPQDRFSRPLIESAKDVIRLGWPHRNEYFSVRLMLRSMIRSAKELRDAREVDDDDAP